MGTERKSKRNSSNLLHLSPSHTSDVPSHLKTEYAYVRPLGFGKFGAVVEARHKSSSTQKAVAIKMVSRKGQNGENHDHLIMTELTVMYKVRRYGGDHAEHFPKVLEFMLVCEGGCCQGSVS